MKVSRRQYFWNFRLLILPATVPAQRTHDTSRGGNRPPLPPCEIRLWSWIGVRFTDCFWIHSYRLPTFFSEYYSIQTNAVLSLWWWWWVVVLVGGGVGGWWCWWVSLNLTTVLVVGVLPVVGLKLISCRPNDWLLLQLKSTELFCQMLISYSVRWKFPWMLLFFLFRIILIFLTSLKEWK